MCIVFYWDIFQNSHSMMNEENYNWGIKMENRKRRRDKKKKEESKKLGTGIVLFPEE